MSRRTTLDPETRFLMKIEQGGASGDCWLWTGFCGRGAGYGQFFFDGRQGYAHRFAFQHFVGPIPDGMTIDHVCRNRACVNPAHLEAVTHRENVLRGDSPMARQARQTHCKRGHEFTEANTLLYRGQRVCRRCNAIRTTAKLRRRKAARDGQV